MPKKRFSAEQIVTLLRQIEVSMAQGKSAPEACRAAEISNFAHPRAVTARLDRSEPHAEHCTSARGLHHFSGACSPSAHSPEPLFRSMIRPRTRSIAGE